MRARPIPMIDGRSSFNVGIVRKRGLGWVGFCIKLCMVFLFVPVKKGGRRRAGTRGQGEVGSAYPRYI